MIYGRSTRRTRDPYPDGPSGRLELRAQPGVIRHVLSAPRGDVRSLQLSLQHADFRVDVELIDPALLIMQLQSAMHWLETGEEPA